MSSFNSRPTVLCMSGDAVKTDDLIAQIETDKVTIDVRAPSDGILQSILVLNLTRFCDPISVFLADSCSFYWTVPAGQPFCFYP